MVELKKGPGFLAMTMYGHMPSYVNCTIFSDLKPIVVIHNHKHNHKI